MREVRDEVFEKQRLPNALRSVEQDQLAGCNPLAQSLDLFFSMEDSRHRLNLISNYSLSARCAVALIDSIAELIASMPD